MQDLNKAQAQLDEKQRELDAVQAMYDQAMKEKQVNRQLPRILLKRAWSNKFLSTNWSHIIFIENKCIYSIEID